MKLAKVCLDTWDFRNPMPLWTYDLGVWHRWHSNMFLEIVDDVL